MCKKFSEALDNGTVITRGNSYYIRGEPDLREEGISRDYSDPWTAGEPIITDMTEEVQITHCPFCGDKLRGEES